MKCFISFKQVFTNIMKKLNEVEVWSLAINLLINLKKTKKFAICYEKCHK